ncbi:MAG: S1/P1 nuclease [Ferruginibacter sp.]
MIRKFNNTLLVGLFLCLPFCGMAWGMLGHRIVGQIADSYLTKKTKKEIFNILGNESIAMASNWPDFIKSDPAYAYLNNWHYINFKGGFSEAEIKDYLATDSLTDVYTKINWLSGQLKNKELEQDKKGFYLRLLIHLVGDIHQPLHVGRYEDLGGNKIRVTWFKDSVNLHQVWDSKLIEHQQLSYTEYASAINYTTKSQRKAWEAEPVSEWVWQSYQVAGKIYGEVKSGDKLGYDYDFKYNAILNQQLLKGGVHLAWLLNDIFR